jgi:hypothetical protein
MSESSDGVRENRKLMSVMSVRYVYVYEYRQPTGIF